MLGRNRRKKVRKSVFYIQTNVVNKKWGEKMRETIFPETDEYCEQNIMGKNRRKKVRKKGFCIHKNIVTKKWGKKRAKQFFQKHKNRASKN